MKTKLEFDTEDIKKIIETHLREKYTVGHSVIVSQDSRRAVEVIAVFEVTEKKKGS